MNSRNLGVLFLFFFAISGKAQDFQFSFHQLSPLQGLSQGTNAFVFRDSRGFVWLSSIDGLNRFDGRTVKVYKAGTGSGLLDNIISSSFFEDKQANLWFTTYEGVHCYLRNEDRFEHYQLINEAGDTIRQDYAAFHLEGDENLWLRTGLDAAGRLHWFNIENFQDSIVCPLDGNRNQVLRNNAGEITAVVSSLFYGRPGIEIRSLNAPFNLTTYFSEEGQLPILSSNNVLAQADSTLWLAMEGGLVKFDLQTETPTFFNSISKENLWTPAGSAIGDTWAVGRLTENYLLVASSLQGVLIFDTERAEFVQQIPFNDADAFGLNLTGINAFYVDQQENLWLSSTRGGLCYANLNKRKFPTVAALQNTAVTALYETSDGVVWSSGKSGEVFRFLAEPRPAEVLRPSLDGVQKKSSYGLQKVPLKSQDSGERFGKISFFFEDEQQGLWACSGRKLFKWQPSSAVFYYVQDLPANVLYMHTTKSGLQLAATYAGVYNLQLEEDRFSFSPFTALQEFQAQLATAIYEDDSERIYLALDANRLVVLAKEDTVYKELAAIDQLGYVKSFYETSDTLWAATTNGLLAIDLHTLQEELLNEEEHGLPNDNFYCALPDEAGNFWLSCNQGLIRYNHENKSYRRYSLADGLQDVEYNTNAFLRSADGRIWMGGNEGLNVFYPSAVKDVPYAPQLQFSELLINDEPYNTEVQIGELQSLDLPYWQNTISLSAVALEYSDPTFNSFKYRLVNYDDEWVEAGTNGFVRYPKLPSGTYDFQVKAANSDGVWSESPHSLSIYIRTPWWQTWWFYLCAALALGGIVYGVFTYRLRQALKLERMRVKISSDLHDDVGSLLTGLAMQAEVVEMTAKDENKPRLNKISELSRSALSRMRDTVWAIDARKDKLENLIFRMQEHAEDTLTPKGLRFEIKIDPQLDMSKTLPSNVRQNLYLIYKEAVTNAAKYTNGKKVTTTLNKLGQGVSMQIHDDGAVKEKAYVSSGLGLSNMQMRAEQIGGTFEIDKTDGYRILVKLPKIN